MRRFLHAMGQFVLKYFPLQKLTDASVETPSGGVRYSLAQISQQAINQTSVSPAF